MTEADRADLLVEIGTEELPPGSLASLSDAFAAGVGAGLESVGLACRGVDPFATPRRLAVIARDVPAAIPGRMRERRGPAVAAAFDAEGGPDPSRPGVRPLLRGGGRRPRTDRDREGGVARAPGGGAAASRRRTRPGRDRGRPRRPPHRAAHALGRRRSAVRSAGALARAPPRPRSRRRDRPRGPRGTRDPGPPLPSPGAHRARRCRSVRGEAPKSGKGDCIVRRARPARRAARHGRGGGGSAEGRPPAATSSRR